MQAVLHFTQIFSEISQRPEGQALVISAGGKELFNALISSLPPSEAQVVQAIESLMHMLVEAEPHLQLSYKNQPGHGSRETTEVFPQIDSASGRGAAQVDEARSEMASV